MNLNSIWFGCSLEKKGKENRKEPSPKPSNSPAPAQPATARSLPRPARAGPASSAAPPAQLALHLGPSPGAQPSSPPFAPRARPTHSPRTTSAQNASPFPTCQRPRALPATPGPRVSGSPFPFLSLCSATPRPRSPASSPGSLSRCAPPRSPEPPYIWPLRPSFPHPRITAPPHEP